MLSSVTTVCQVQNKLHGRGKRRRETGFEPLIYKFPLHVRSQEAVSSSHNMATYKFVKTKTGEKIKTYDFENISPHNLITVMKAAV